MTDIQPILVLSDKQQVRTDITKDNGLEIKTWNDNTTSVSCSGHITLSQIDEICP